MSIQLTRGSMTGEAALEWLIHNGRGVVTDYALYREPTPLPLGPEWSPADLAENVIDASTGPQLLNAAAVASAVAANRQLAVQLAWRDRYDAICIYYLRYRSFTPIESEFAQGIARWQHAVGGGLPVNGILDARTWQIMRPRGEPDTFTTTSGVVRPQGYAQVVQTFGDPSQNNAAWEAANIVPASAPAGFQFQLVAGGTRNTVRVHRLLQTHFEALFQAIANAGLWQAIQPVSGPYAYRPVRGGTQLSMHAFGIAIDINPAQFPRGQARVYPDPYVVQIFQDYGFHWGIFFRTADPMHFQFATGA